ncbi:hypothetical protein EGR_11171 [Echinococcus granulosus]|uniref:Uncharacterized protein n=1 Tax=Echinococcus granulosus TaxID=6210 RepID=W6U6M1_ECHGR|nr:hypothetical protein EGR_11171 [Echinococcus granulosus]EUB53972.1 hypothetical protein EGR_11171 [Echinococcus granulosus]
MSFKKFWDRFIVQSCTHLLACHLKFFLGYVYNSIVLSNYISAFHQLSLMPIIKMHPSGLQTVTLERRNILNVEARFILVFCFNYVCFPLIAQMKLFCIVKAVVDCANMDDGKVKVGNQMFPSLHESQKILTLEFLASQWCN